MISVEDGSIYTDGTKIGYYTLSKNTLSDIFIRSEHRMNSIGTECVKNICEKVKDNGYNHIRVIGVISDPMIKVLENNGFSNSKNIDIKQIYGLSFDIPEKENTWIKKLNGNK